MNRERENVCVCLCIPRHQQQSPISPPAWCLIVCLGNCAKVALHFQSIESINQAVVSSSFLARLAIIASLPRTAIQTPWGTKVIRRVLSVSRCLVCLR